MENEKNDNWVEENSSTPEIKLPTALDHPAIQFLKKQRIPLFVGLVLVSVFAMFLVGQPGEDSTLKTQLNTGELTVPADDADEVAPPKVVERPDPLDSLPSDTNDPLSFSREASDLDDLFVSSGFSEGSGYDRSHESFLNPLESGSGALLHPSATLGGDETTDSGPGTLAVLVLSILIVLGMSFVQKRA